MCVCEHWQGHCNHMNLMFVILLSAVKYRGKIICFGVQRPGFESGLLAHLFIHSFIQQILVNASTDQSLVNPGYSKKNKIFLKLAHTSEIWTYKQTPLLECDKCFKSSEYGMPCD